MLAQPVMYCLTKRKRQKNINTRPEKTPDDFSSDNTVSIINRNDTHGENAWLEDVKVSAV